MGMTRIRYYGVYVFVIPIDCATAPLRRFSGELGDSLSYGFLLGVAGAVLLQVLQGLAIKPQGGE